MINLGVLQEVPNKTFLYTGQISLGEGYKYWIVGFETEKKDGHRSFLLKAAENEAEVQVILDSLSNTRQESVKKKVSVPVDDSHLKASKSNDNQPSLF